MAPERAVQDTVIDLAVVPEVDGALDRAAGTVRIKAPPVLGADATDVPTELVAVTFATTS